MQQSIIHVDNISKYIGSQCILDSINFTIYEGTLVSIVGPNGAGKSTLIKIILGIDKDFSGTVTIANKKNIAYLPQLQNGDFYQLPLSVHEYLSIGNSSLYHISKSTMPFATALAHVGIAKELLTESIHSLSGGERQRIAIARALLSNPKILVLDEPLASVDHASRKSLYDLIAHLSTDHAITVILVSHDIEYVSSISDQVFCLNKSLHLGCSLNGTVNEISFFQKD